MGLKDALATALMWYLDVDPCEGVAWGTADSVNDLAAAILADPAFREALTAALTWSLIEVDIEAMGDDIVEWWRKGPKPLAAAIVARLLPDAATIADPAPTPEHDAPHEVKR